MAFTAAVYLFWPAYAAQLRANSKVARAWLWIEPRVEKMVEESVLPSARSSHPDEQQPQLWLSGSKASRHGWVRVSDGTERVFYHSIDSGKITLERPTDFGDDNPVWADGKCWIRRGSLCVLIE